MSLFDIFSIMSGRSFCEEPIEALEIADSVNPKLREALKELHSFIWRDGALPLKYKHLIALALSICRGVEEKQAHKVLRRAIDSGATPDEVIETLLVVAWVEGIPAFVASRSILEALKGKE